MSARRQTAECVGRTSPVPRAMGSSSSSSRSLPSSSSLPAQGRPDGGADKARRLVLEGAPEQVWGVQRARLLAAAAQSACELGAGNVTVAHIVQRAGVSRRTFYEVFSDTEDCLVAALQDALWRARERALPAWNAEGPWRERLRSSLVELLCLFDEEPAVARLLIVESLAMGRHSVLAQRARVLERLTDAVHEGRACAKSGFEPSRFSAEGAVGGALAMLHTRILAQDGVGVGRLAELAGPLMSMLVLPYLGARAARRELERPAPAGTVAGTGEEPAPLPYDAFKRAGMRVTYRTITVLGAISAHPGSSNRKIGQFAQMADQGQISKLLARLERQGMIVNGEQGQRFRGEANAWALTPLGEQVASSLGVRAEHTHPPKRDAKREDTA